MIASPPPRRMSDGHAAPAAARGEEQLGRGAALALLAAIFVLAAAVRFWRLSWGLAEGMFFPDEKDVWASYFFAFRAPNADAFLRHDLNYPTLYGYVVGVATSLAHGTGVLGPGRDVAGAILLARSVSAIAGTCTVLLVGVLARRAYGTRAGLFAAALMAVAPFEVVQTHYANVDLLLGSWTALTLLLACRLASSGSAAIAVAAGASVGLAFGTKYPGIALAAMPAWAVFEVAWARRSWRALILLGGLALLGFVLAFPLACPPCVLQSDRWLRALSWLRFLATSGWAPPNGYIVPSLGWYARPYLYQLVASLPYALGWPLYASALVGIVVAARRHALADRVVLVGLLAYFVTQGRTALSFPRYLLPLFPGLVVLAGRALAQLPVRRSLQRALSAGVFAYTLLFTLSQVARFSYEQQRGVAAWLGTALARASQPAGAPPRVAVPSSMDHYYALDQPLARVGIAPLRVGDGHWFEARPDAFVLPEWLRISVRRDRNNPAQERDLDALDSGAAGYVEVARFASRYLDQDLYTRLDPAFAGDLYVGEIGFRVYLRDDLVTAPPAHAADPR